MSDVLGVLRVGEIELHLVDWDRPVWFIANNPEGLRVVPNPDYFITDAIAVFADNCLAECDESCGHNADGLNNLDLDPVCIHLESARITARENANVEISFTYAGDFSEELIEQDAARFKKPISISHSK